MNLSPIKTPMQHSIQSKKLMEMFTNRRCSLAIEIGKEGKIIEKNAYEGKKIALLTSGGDAQGMLIL